MILPVHKARVADEGSKKRRQTDESTLSTAQNTSIEQRPRVQPEEALGPSSDPEERKTQARPFKSLPATFKVAIVPNTYPGETFTGTASGADGCSSAWDSATPGIQGSYELDDHHVVTRAEDSGVGDVSISDPSNLGSSAELAAGSVFMSC